MKVLREPGILSGGGGGGAPPETTWHAALPEDLRQVPALQQIKGKDWGEAGPVLAKSYVEAQKLIGTDKVPAPQKHWGDKEWAEYFGRAGRPEKPDGYKLPEGVKFSDGVKLDDAKFAKAQEHFHKLNLTAAQAEGVMGYYINSLNEAVDGDRTAAEQAHINGTAALKKEFGGDVQYAAAVDMAKSVVTRFGTPELSEFLSKNPTIGSNPEMVKFLHKVAGIISEDKARGPGGGPAIVNGATAAIGEITRLRADQEFQEALHSRDNPQHKDAVERWAHLFRVAYPGKERD